MPFKCLSMLERKEAEQTWSNFSIDWQGYQRIRTGFSSTFVSQCISKRAFPSITFFPLSLSPLCEWWPSIWLCSLLILILTSSISLWVIFGHFWWTFLPHFSSHLHPFHLGRLWFDALDLESRGDPTLFGPNDLPPVLSTGEFRVRGDALASLSESGFGGFDLWCSGPRDCHWSKTEDVQRDWNHIILSDHHHHFKSSSSSSSSSQKRM